MKSEKLQYPIAVLSDVCANLEALEAVLADIKTQHVKSILFLGDAIGYGPNPVECVDLLRDVVNIYLLGQMEKFLLEEVYKNEPNPLRDKNVLEYASERLKKTKEPRRGRERRLEWLSGRQEEFNFEMFYAAYCPREIVGKPPFPDNPMTSLKSKLERYFKSHQFVVLSGNKMPWYTNLNTDLCTPATDSKSVQIDFVAPTIISPGSVGQPRDKDSRACYLIFSERVFCWRRVSYDVEKTAEKIKANSQLSPTNAARLFKGY